MHTGITVFVFTAILLNFQLISSKDHSDLRNRHFGLAANASDNFFKDISNENWLLKAHIHCNETRVDLQEGRYMSDQAHDYYDPSHRYWSNYTIQCILYAKNTEPIL
jgi:hypothetical protein